MRCTGPEQPVTLPVLYGVGVDPGARSGAAVLLRQAADGQLGARWRSSWIVLPRKGGPALRLTSRLWDGVAEVEEYSSTSDLYAAVAAGLRRAVGGLSGVDAMPAMVAVEGLFFDARSAAGAAALHERTGDLLGCLARAGLRADARPPAASWRPAILGIPGNTGAAPAEAAAIRWANARVWPAGAQAPTGVEEGALAEAAAIALYGLQVWRRQGGA